MLDLNSVNNAGTPTAHEETVSFLDICTCCKDCYDECGSEKVLKILSFYLFVCTFRMDICIFYKL